MGSKIRRSHIEALTYPKGTKNVGLHETFVVLAQPKFRMNPYSQRACQSHHSTAFCRNWCLLFWSKTKERWRKCGFFRLSVLRCTISPPNRTLRRPIVSLSSESACPNIPIFRSGTAPEASGREFSRADMRFCLPIRDSLILPANYSDQWKSLLIKGRWPIEATVNAVKLWTDDSACPTALL